MQWVYLAGLVLILACLIFLMESKVFRKKRTATEKTGSTGKEAKEGGKKAAVESAARASRDGVDRYSLRGYIPEEKLPAGSKRELDEVMVYSQFLKRFPEFKADARIGATDKVLVVRTLSTKKQGDHNQLFISTIVYLVSTGNLLLESVRPRN